MAVTAARERTLLAMLLLHANDPVSVDRLIEAIWPSRRPRDARNQLQLCVTQLRRRVASAGGDRGIVVTGPGTYRLAVGPDDLDLYEFRRLVAEARTRAGAGHPESAYAMYRSALALWRGPVLADVESPLVRQAAAALNDERVQVLEQCVDVAVTQDAARALLSSLNQLAEDHPYREGLHRARMLALYRAGRYADALDAYRTVRRLLREDLGAEPGRDLRDLHRAILNRDPSLDGRSSGSIAATPPRPRQLPAGIPRFTGRDDELKALDELLPDGEHTTGPVVISAIAGTAGIGKTALAIHWAHRVADRFPDGQLYVNLRGFDPSGPPVEPAVALRGLLEALIVPPRHIPSDPDAQTGLYRSLLADRRMLVVLDNAFDAEQVRPLLPGSSSCLVLITSRNQLSGLVATEGATPLVLDTLPDDDARRLLAARLGPERVVAEPVAVADLLAACAGLPLALAIVAARAAVRPGHRLTTVAEEVRRARSTLDPWSGPDRASDLRAVLSSSYRALDAETARLFRLLGLHPGPDLAIPAAASLAAIEPQHARRLLDRLAQANLVIEHRPGRWTLHDLLHAYAAELAEATDREHDRHSSLHRLLDHYLHVAHAAALLVDPHRGPPYTPAPPRPGVANIDLSDQGQAMAWLTGEQAVLVRAIELGALIGLDSHAWHLASCLNVFFERHGYHFQILHVQAVALRAAERRGDVLAQAVAHAAIGVAYGAMGSYELAREHHERALDYRRQLGDLRGQALAHVNLAWLEYRQENFDGALRESRRAHELFLEAGDRAWQGRTLNMIAWCHCQLGDHRQAVALCSRGLAIQQEVGDASEEGFTWDTLGVAHHQLGDLAQAIDCFQRALALFDKHDNRRGRATVLHHLGNAQHAAGRTGAARSAWRAALELSEALGERIAAEVSAKLAQVDRSEIDVVKRDT